jgi:DNA-binding CsgD family transcriptional regulator
MKGGIERLIESIYEAAAFPELWPVVLRELGKQGRTSAGFVLLTRRSDAWTGYLAAEEIDTAFSSYMASNIAPRSNTTRRLLERDRSGFVSDTDLFSEDEWEKEPLRDEWARHWGLNHAAATAIRVPTEDFIVFHGHRRESEPAYHPDDLSVLDAFRPHLARAALLAARWRLQRLRSVAEALGLIGLPAAILDGNGRVLAANDLIQSLKKHLRWLPNDQLALVDPAAQENLRNALREIHSPTASARSFVVRSAEEMPVVAHFVPAAGAAKHLFDGGSAILAITPVTVSPVPDVSLIRALFDLSPGEARIAAGIANGKSIDKLAEFAGVSRNTVRSQLKNVFTKTGTTRQAEIAALLSGLHKLPSK